MHCEYERPSEKVKVLYMLSLIDPVFVKTLCFLEKEAAVCHPVFIDGISRPVGLTANPEFECAPVVCVPPRLGDPAFNFLHEVLVTHVNSDQGDSRSIPQ